MIVGGWRCAVAQCALLAASAGCIRWHEYPLRPTTSAPIASASAPGARGFQAGFGRADITPPPGVGFGGYGPEARIATGYRLRLYARALVLEDARGERVAVVVADLPLISSNLQRLTAQHVRDSTPIGADRLILAATHTHSGPSNYAAERQYNQDVSSVSGYDSALVEFLVTRLSAAVIQAYGRRRAARIAWGMTPVWGHTRNRSYDAVLRNKPAWTPPFPPPAGLEPAQRAIDPTWTLVRIDLQGLAGDTTYYPAGALSIFAMHGTGNPAANDLYDADIQGLVERGLERHIDSLDDAAHGQTPHAPAFATRAVHLVANGTEGDASPDWPANTRCPLPTLRPVLTPGGPRTPPAPWTWQPAPRAQVARCLGWARAYVDAVGDSLTLHAAALFDSLRRSLTRSLDLAVAFQTVPLRGDSSGELCPSAEVGSATLVGAKDGPTRLRGWRLLGLLPIGLEEGGSAVNPDPSGCQREKRVVLGSGPARLLKHWLIGRHGFPDTTQLAVVRLGGLLVGAVPAEATTMTGVALKRAIADSARANGLAVEGVAVMSLANGYLTYVTTAAEYSAQDFEGASTLFGPGSAAFLARQMGQLAAALARAGGQSPPSRVTPFTAYPGFHRAFLPRRTGKPPDPAARRFLATVCRSDTVVSRWVDAGAAWLPLDSGQVLAIERQDGSRWTTVAWDDDPRVEVRMVTRVDDRTAWWEMRWARPARGRAYRVVLRERGPFRAVADSVACP